ncbi:hypothetical protein Tco_1239841, partial [Tanacetum coccineum]
QSITYSGSGQAEVEGCGHHIDFLSELSSIVYCFS